MRRARDLPAAGFHAGELAVQARAGVRAEAARLSGMLDPVELRGGIVAFLNDRTFAVITGRDASGRLWTSLLTGQAGFIEVTSPSVVTIRSSFPPADPLNGLPSGQEVGLVVMEFAARRRVRINGTVTTVGDGSLVVRVEQAFGNCPQYIRKRVLVPHEMSEESSARARLDVVLSADDVELIRSADTFFLGTTHPDRGADTSHRGGPAGFVQVEGNDLWWPDYPGNNMFNSFGNLAVDPTAALLFLDFHTGRTLQLSGVAAVEFSAPRDIGNDAGTGRRARFTTQRLVSAHLLASHET